jgi:hypothetical protein
MCLSTLAKTNHYALRDETLVDRRQVMARGRQVFAASGGFLPWEYLPGGAVRDNILPLRFSYFTLQGSYLFGHL